MSKSKIKLVPVKIVVANTFMKIPGVGKATAAKQADDIKTLMREVSCVQKTRFYQDWDEGCPDIERCVRYGRALGRIDLNKFVEVK